MKLYSGAHNIEEQNKASTKQMTNSNLNLTPLSNSNTTLQHCKKTRQQEIKNKIKTFELISLECLKFK